MMVTVRPIKKGHNFALICNRIIGRQKLHTVSSYVVHKTAFDEYTQNVVNTWSEANCPDVQSK